MKNILISFFKKQNKCNHKNALIHANEGYCPDCGQYLVKNYYLIRCSRCEIKRNAKLYWDEIIPTSKYCSNCGCEEYYIEKIDNINFVDAQYALYIKEIANEIQDLHPETQIWVDENEGIIRKRNISENDELHESKEEEQKMNERSPLDKLMNYHEKSLKNHLTGTRISLPPM